MAQQTRAYPVYRSPDGTAEQVAATPAREVQLKHAGWVKLTQPRCLSAPREDAEPRRAKEGTSARRRSSRARGSQATEK